MEVWGRMWVVVRVYGGGETCMTEMGNGRYRRRKTEQEYSLRIEKVVDSVHRPT